jgi:23S rRNA (uracil1939-C5)-methyltransferase
MAETLEVRIEKLVYGGEGLGRVEGRAVFVAGTAPGDLVLARVVEQKKGFARAELVEVLEPGASRRDAPCPVYGRCGGCQLQHVDYATQVEAKRAFVRDTLERIGRLTLPGEVRMHADPEHEFGYRVRATAHLAATREGVLFGYFGARSHRIVDVESCPLLVPDLDAAWRRARSERQGMHRVRTLDLAAGDDRVATDPPVAAVGGAELETEIDGVKYRFSPSVFFQANRPLLGALVRGATGGEERGGLALDLFAGVGLFAIPLARRFERVVAVEGDSRAAAFARANARANDAGAVDVVIEPVEQWLDREPVAPGSVDHALVDPPRAGLGLDASRALARLTPRRVVYVSCDPSTLARDLRVLVDSGYALESVDAYDLFPQTYHVETIAKLNLQ